MSLLSAMKRQLTKLAGASATKMGDIIIFTTVAGWMASSAAQIFGIAKNKNYSREQKKYMINQEMFDALTNIGLYFGITKSLTMLSSTLVKTAKIAPKSIVGFMNKNGLMGQRGRLGFDITQVKGFQANDNLRGTYNAFKCFADASAATIGGIISSNIVTPIVRNRIAAHRQNRFKEHYAAKTQVAEMNQMAQNAPERRTTVINTPSHSFEGYRRHVLSI